MGSLNGDVMVIRNGRSTSQVSIYNYPEHLNPFYEDDQHKRLRFWKISKKDNDGRRNSFSIANLKDMWAFKSFRMKKKSSTLGINKTSESPPMLRREIAIDNGWNTMDHRLRGSNVTSLNYDNFQRNATYRSSLQTLPTSNADHIGLNRNDGYRSTIQVTRSNPRYQPQQRPQSTGVPQNRRSSQTSMVSTNPFESDDDNEDINSSGIRSVNSGSTTTLTSRTPRKKRRAPAPPTPMHNRSNTASPPTIIIESSHDNTNDELHIKEDIDIANLTAEIQNFVETTNNDDVEITPEHKDNRLTTERTTSPIRENVEAKEDENTKVTSTAASEELKTGQIESALDNSTHINQNSKKEFNYSTEEKVKPAHKENSKITTELATVTTTTKTLATTSSSENIKPLEQESNSTKVTNIVEMQKNESNEIKTNGAIPKKPNNITDSISSGDRQQSINVIDDLCIKETKTDNVQQKPVPLQRQTKSEPEVGHVECVHIHVASPRATPRKEHQSGVSSFKTGQSLKDTETITTKTPFVLTSPPTHRKDIQTQVENTSVVKETVRIIKSSNANERINELNINEEQTNAKPEIMNRPTLSPKPVLKQPNVKSPGFAEIHKPMRSKYSSSQNGHVKRTSRGESVSPPSLHYENSKEEEEEKIINNITLKQVESSEVESKAQQPTLLKIVENSSIESQRKHANCENEVKSAKDHFRRDDELELLYRSKQTPQMEWKRSTLAPLEAHIPPEKRKSVKDIIESINRSQRLLNAAANKDFTTISNTTMNTTNDSPDGPNSMETTKTTDTNNINNNFNEDLRILDERQKEIQRMVKEMDQAVENTNGATAVSISCSPSPSNYNEEIADAQKLDNSEIFQKCKVKKEVYDYRESSPISSNLDWNPLPKPKRTKPGHD